ncbi:MAG: hypothetical protein ACK4VO_13700 [Pseudobdellovibrio sp.]
MNKKIIIISTLLSITNASLSADMRLNINDSEKDFVIMLAKPSERLILQEFLSKDEISNDQVLVVKEILNRLLSESDMSNPMSSSFNFETVCVKFDPRT